MSLSDRMRIRPVLYPTVLLLVAVLDLVVSAGHGRESAVAGQVSIWAAGRPLIAATVVGLGITWALGLLMGDRDMAGLVAALLIVRLLTDTESIVMTLAFLVIFACGFWTALRVLSARRRHGARRSWRTVTRAGNAVAAILVVALGIEAIQYGQVQTIAHDLVAESPLRPVAATAALAADVPDVYLILLDGHPRQDMLQERFGIDTSGFTEALEARGFAVAAQSRSNYPSTELTLASMFGGFSAARDDRATDLRRLIDEGPIVDAFRTAGYRITAFATGFESMAMRGADRFIDSGQLNEVEWNLLFRSVAGHAISLVAPQVEPDQHYDRIVSTFDTLEVEVATAPDRPRLVFAHIASPHSPQVFGPDGERLDVGPMDMPFYDQYEYELLGHDEFGRRLAGQVAYIDHRVVRVVDRIVAADPAAVIVVFSDHGLRLTPPTDTSDTDVRTANLLAVRSPGRTGMIHDRSTLVNVLPRILRAYTGSGPADVPETIYDRRADGTFFEFERPD